MPNIWQTKIEKANDYYKQWESRFRCKTLEDYYEGFQWKSLTESPYLKPYSVNLIFAELKKKLANTLYQNLSYELTPRPGHYSYNPELAMNSAALKQDFLNEIIARANKDQGFNEQTKLVALDSYFRFGVMEIAYAADWRNPAKKPPLLSSHDDIDKDDENAKVVEDEEVPENERIYFKRIKASRFRVSVNDDARLENCSWCGYYQYIYKHVLTKTKGLDLPKDFESLGIDYSSEYISKNTSGSPNEASSDSRDMLSALSSGKVLKVWRIFDNEANLFKLILEPSFETIFEDDFYHIPLATHRHNLRLDGFYPIPPVWQWLNPQDEINQAREQMRNYRRRFTRKYKTWGVEQEELEKFKNEIDGEIIKLKNPNSMLEPIANPEIGISILDALNAGRDDFNIVSGSSSDLTTAQADRTTATQSKITANKAAVIESIEQIEFSHFYQKVGRLVLLEAQQKFTGGIWVKNSSDSSINGEAFLSQIDPNKILTVKYITSQDLSDGFDVDIEITCVNASPQRMQDELNKFISFLGIVNQFPQIALSPILIREAAFRTGYRNEKVIAEMQKAALLAMMGQAAGAAKQQGLDLGQMLNNGQSNGGNATNMTRNAIPASTDAVNSQLEGQLNQ